jgi:hypothetical protein
MKIRVLALLFAAGIVVTSAHAQTSTPTPTPTLTKQQAKEAAKKEAYLRKHPPVMVTVHPTDPFAATPEDKAAQAARDQAYKAEALKQDNAAIATTKQRDCLTNLHAGDSSSKVRACGGAPDHTNSDLTTDQLVFANGVIVYIDKATDKVENVQWSN